MSKFTSHPRDRFIKWGENLFSVVRITRITHRRDRSRIFVSFYKCLQQMLASRRRAVIIHVQTFELVPAKVGNVLFHLPVVVRHIELIALLVKTVVRQKGNSQNDVRCEIPVRVDEDGIKWYTWMRNNRVCGLWNYPKRIKLHNTPHAEVAHLRSR